MHRSLVEKFQLHVSHADKVPDPGSTGSRYSAGHDGVIWDLAALARSGGTRLGIGASPAPMCSMVKITRMPAPGEGFQRSVGRQHQIIRTAVVRSKRSRVKEGSFSTLSDTVRFIRRKFPNPSSGLIVSRDDRNNTVELPRVIAFQERSRFRIG